MSRSYRKYPCRTEQSSCRYIKKKKRWASRKVRHAKDVPNFGGYKKIYESWDINDFSLVEFLHTILLDWNDQQWWMLEDYSSWEEAYKDWKLTWKIK